LSVSTIHGLILGGAALVLLYAAAVVVLAVRGRDGRARALAGFIPDCVVLFKRLLQDDRIPRRRKRLVVATLAYLALPFDLVPDFIPVAGQLDDAIVVAFALRSVLRSGGPALLREHWPGPPQSLRVIERLAF
jgi:uncharacterized membrane protein YkvA (DUF1232 family)